MRTIACIVQYDGTRYSGFQRQSHARPTIQGELERALASLIGEPVPVVGAGRTDAGVHAHGQVIHFSTESSIPVDRWPLALNSRLPRDIVVVAAAEPGPGFHARFHARSKTYRYTLWLGEVPSPFWYPYSWWVRRSLDVDAMQQAAQTLVGRHDFAAYAAAGSDVRSTVRTLQRLQVEEVHAPNGSTTGRVVHIWAQADGFLYRMVRNIVGALVAVGTGQHSPEWPARVLAGRRREDGAATAPAQGLSLWSVDYGDAVREWWPPLRLDGTEGFGAARQHR